MRQQHLEAQIADIANAVAPVIDWFQSDEKTPRPLEDIVKDIVGALQGDRAEVIQLRRRNQERRDNIKYSFACSAIADEGIFARDQIAALQEAFAHLMGVPASQLGKTQ